MCCNPEHIKVLKSMSKEYRDHFDLGYPLYSNQNHMQAQERFFSDEYFAQKRYRRSEEEGAEQEPSYPTTGAFYGSCYKPIENQNWVQCEGCDSWRHLPDSVDMAALPEKWYIYLRFFFLQCILL